MCAEDDNTDGYHDPCGLDRGDLDLDGIVGGACMAITLANWGEVYREGVSSSGRDSSRMSR